MKRRIFKIGLPICDGVRKVFKVINSTSPIGTIGWYKIGDCGIIANETIPYPITDNWLVRSKYLSSKLWWEMQALKCRIDLDK